MSKKSGLSFLSTFLNGKKPNKNIIKNENLLPIKPLFGKTL